MTTTKEKRGVKPDGADKSILPVQSEVRGYLGGFSDGHHAGMMSVSDLTHQVLKNVSQLALLNYEISLFGGQIDGIVMANGSGGKLPTKVLKDLGLRIGDVLNKADAIERDLKHLLDPDGDLGYTSLYNYTTAQQRRKAVLDLQDGDEKTAAALRNVIRQWQGTAQDMDIIAALNKRKRIRLSNTQLVAEAMRQKIIDAHLTIDEAAYIVAEAFNYTESTVKSYYYRVYPQSDLQLNKLQMTKEP